MNKATTWLFNPFHFIAGYTALGLGLALLLVTAIASPLLGITFGSILQIGIVSAGFLAELTRLLVITLVPALLFWLAGRFLSPTKTRLLDLVGTQMLARWPVHLYALVSYSIPAVNHAMHTLVTRTEDGRLVVNPIGDQMIFITLSGMFGLFFMAWTVVLMYRSFSVCCNVSGSKAIITFAILLVVANFLAIFCNQAIYIFIFR